MTYLTLHDTPLVHEQIPRFQAILAAYGINIVVCEIQAEDNTIQIVTDARALVDVQSVSAAAYDCFDDAIVKYRTSIFN